MRKRMSMNTNDLNRLKILAKIKEGHLKLLTFFKASSLIKKC